MFRVPQCGPLGRSAAASSTPRRCTQGLRQRRAGPPDGSVELGRSRRGHRPGHHLTSPDFSRGEDVNIETTELTAEVELDADNYVGTALYRADGTQWRFTAAERGQMRSLAAARGDAYHGQAGSVRRVGDDRVPDTSLAWIETFPLNGLDRRYTGQRR